MSDKIASIFLKRVCKSFESNPHQKNQLIGDLLLWGAMIMERQPNTTLGDLITSQLMSAVGEPCKGDINSKVEEVVDGLFAKNPSGELDADIVFARFQLL